MWQPNGLVHQQWYFRPVKDNWAEYLIESVENGHVLDAGPGEELSRMPTMRARTGAARQRWRVARTEDRAGYVVRSVFSGHALDFPVGEPPGRSPHLFECHREFHQQFILADLTAPRLYEWE
jgi:Ricin-type beta-trefoil lectin domain-like